MRILMYTDGSPLADRALNYGAQFVKSAGAEVTLLGIVTSPGRDAQVQAALDHAQSLFPRPAEVKVRAGRPANEVLAEAATGRYDLIVMGSRGRRGWQRVAFGSVAARLARSSPIPVLIVKGGRMVVRKVLACTSGDVRGERVARWGGHVAYWLKAETTILHVMSQIPMSPQANLDELDETAEEAIARHTREGKHLAHEVELVQAQGAATSVMPKLRYGLVREEIVAEVAEGDYDLVVIGGHQAPDLGGSRSRIREYLLEDVTDHIIMDVNRPILVVKGN
jgi:nucleotide-binding universal stress UspA family protein